MRFCQACNTPITHGLLCANCIRLPLIAPHGADEVERRLELRAQEIAQPWKKWTLVLGAFSLVVPIALVLVGYFGVPEQIRKEVANKMTEGPIRQAAIDATTNAMAQYVAGQLVPLSRTLLAAQQDFDRLKREQQAFRTESSNWVAELRQGLSSAVRDTESLLAQSKDAQATASNALQQAAALAPEKQPIATVSAEAHISVKGVARRGTFPGEYSLTFGRLSEVKTNLWMIGLSSEKAEVWANNVGEGSCFIQFRQIEPRSIYNLSPDSNAKVFDDFNVFTFHLGFLFTGDVEVTGGVVTVTINSAVKRTYSLPRFRIDRPLPLIRTAPEKGIPAVIFHSPVDMGNGVTAFTIPDVQPTNGVKAKSVLP